MRWVVENNWKNRPYFTVLSQKVIKNIHKPVVLILVYLLKRWKD